MNWFACRWVEKVFDPLQPKQIKINCRDFWSQLMYIKHKCQPNGFPSQWARHKKAVKGCQGQDCQLA